MLVTHRASEPPKLADRAPASAHRVWSVRLVLALLVALLLVSNAAHAAGRGRAVGVATQKTITIEQLRRRGQLQEVKRRLEKKLKEVKRRLEEQPGKDGAEVKRRQLEEQLKLHQPGKDGAEVNGKVLKSPKPPSSILDSYLEIIRKTRARTAPLEPMRLPDGRYKLFLLSQIESKQPAQKVYHYTEKVLQQHPVELLVRHANGSFRAVSMSTTVPRNKKFFQSYAIVISPP